MTWWHPAPDRSRARPAPLRGEQQASPGPVPRAVRLGALAAACLVCLAAGLAGVLGWRWLCLLLEAEALATLPALQTPALVLNAVIPVLGNGLSWFMSFRRATPRSLLLFLGPSSCLTVVGVAASAAQLPASSGPLHLAVTAVVVVLPAVVTVAVLLTLPRPAPR